MKKKSIWVATTTLALSLAIGGGLWADPSVNAASSTSASKANAALDSTSTDKAEHTGKQGKRGLGFGLGKFESQLAEYLKLSSDELKEKLKTATLAEVASEQGISRDDLKAKLVEWLDAQAAELPSDKADKLDSSAIADKLLNSKGGAVGGRGMGGGGKGEFGSIGRVDNTALLDLLGLTAEELKADLKDGQSLAAIAEKQGVDVQKVIDLEVSAAKAKLDEALTSGKLTQEQYDTKLTNITDRVTKQVNGTFEFTKEARGGHMGGGHFGKGKGAGAEAPSESNSAGSTTA
ncbi:hypothetical protein PALU110988_14765 [Paenibacillus lupini]